MIDVLDVVSPGHGFVVDDVRPHLRDGFPWHRPEEGHAHLSTPDLWWQNMAPLFRGCFDALGVEPTVVAEPVDVIRSRYCDASKFELFPDSVAALAALRAAGWEVVVLSNHVPELPAIVEAVGLGGLIDEVYTSAAIGFEKPHPDAYRAGLGGWKPSQCYMVGDNPEADVRGAERRGIRAILVRTDDLSVPRRAQDVLGAVELIIGRQGIGRSGSAAGVGV